MKTYARSTYTCCAGTYLQAVTEYANLVYFQDTAGLYVNLYLPSEVVWQRPGGDVTLSQETAFPESETVTFTLKLAAPARFALRFRVPGWATSFATSVNGQGEEAKAAPGTWASIEREWKDGDKIVLQLPLTFRYEAVDKQHPDRVAVVRGPAVFVLDATVHEPSWALPASDEELNRLVVPDRNGQFALRLAGNNAFDPSASSASQAPGRRGNATAPAAPAAPVAGAKFIPFYAIEEVNAYRMYMDRNVPPTVLW
jgi:DUF1680 family protein